jgi:hypothetical protein
VPFSDQGMVQAHHGYTGTSGVSRCVDLKDVHVLTTCF